MLFRSKVQKDLDIAEYTDPEHNPMIPHVIVLEPGLVIFKIYNGYWFFGRPTIEELRQDLRAVLKKCRPDWDITRPELKAAWEQGQRDPKRAARAVVSGTGADVNARPVARKNAEKKEILAKMARKPWC